MNSAEYVGAALTLSLASTLLFIYWDVTIRFGMIAKMSLVIGDLALFIVIVSAISNAGIFVMPLILAYCFFHLVCVIRMARICRPVQALQVGVVALVLAGVIFPIVFVLAYAHEEKRHYTDEW